MDLEQRLKQLESYQDWQGVVETLEQGISGAQDAATKAGLHLRLGRVLHRHFLQGVRALKHFQDAYKQNSALTEALAEARNIYWELGKLNMVQKLLELQLKGASDNATKKALYRELGDVLVDLGDYDRATESYAKALQSSDGSPGEILVRGYNVVESRLRSPEGYMEAVACATSVEFEVLREYNDANGTKYVPSSMPLEVEALVRDRKSTTCLRPADSRVVPDALEVPLTLELGPYPGL